MSTAIQALIPAESDLVREEQQADAVVAAVNPATVAAFVQIGVQLLHFAATLFGGKTGAALNDIANVINGLNVQLVTISNQVQQMLANIQETITSFDQAELAKLSPVHTQVMSYLVAYPNGVPNIADTGNINYALAHQATSSATTYFQGINRGPLTFMPPLCHATNSRMELAISAWPCWYTQSSPAQPFFNQELNVSSGKLSSNISWARPHIGKEIYVKKLTTSSHVVFDTPIDTDPPLPPEIVGWQVRDGGKVIWEKKDPDAYGQALNVRDSNRRKRQNEIMAGYLGNLDKWVGMSARQAPAGIARALDLGDADMFTRFVNPSALVMEEKSEDTDQPVYRALPMRDILLDLLTSDAMRARHGLLVKGANKRAINTWFEKTFFRAPSEAELSALTQVSELFGNDAFFGCLAYSDEYKARFGDGIPTSVDRPKSAPAPGPITKIA